MDTSRVKQLNTNLIRAAIKTSRGKTKADISISTGLSQATCNTILNELVKSGEVLELDHEVYGGGRPAKRYTYNGDYGMVVCLYFDNDSNKPTISYRVINLLGEVKAEKTLRKASIDYDTIEDLLRELISRHKNVKAAAIGIPGVVIKRKIISICDFENLSGSPMADKLQKKYGIAVTLENDMNVTALGYYQQQNYEEETSISVLNFLKDNCPGSGIIVDGNIITGHTHFAGEISYLPLGYKLNELKNRNDIIESLYKTICSITAVINPETVLVTGGLVSEDMIEPTRLKCLKIIPEIHMPNIVYQKSIHEYYLKGLAQMAFESLSYPI